MDSSGGAGGGAGAEGAGAEGAGAGGGVGSGTGEGVGAMGSVRDLRSVDIHVLLNGSTDQVKQKRPIISP